MNIFILDNYDSFTYNLVHVIEQFANVKIKRNTEVEFSDLKLFDKIVFSPGPGIPSEVDVMYKIIETYKETKAILGVCLGHQAIAEYFGAKLLNMPEVNHGREFKTEIIKQDYLFQNLPNRFNSARYHSWIVSKDSFPNDLEITSVDSETQNIMSLRHKAYDTRGIQFHPESIMTKYGKQILKNWVEY